MSKSPSENREFHQILLEKMINSTDIYEEIPNIQRAKQTFQSEKPVFSSEKLNFERGNDPFLSQVIQFQPQSAKGYKTKTPLKKADVGHKTQANQSRNKTLVDAKERAFDAHALSKTAQITLLTLGLPRENDSVIRLSEVKKAFRRMARELHPDLNPTTNSLEFTSLKTATDALIKEMQSLKVA